MDLDSTILFLFFIVFFVLPSILKQVLARKKKASTMKTAKNKKKPSIFDKIGEQIRQFVQELENQAKLQKKQTREQGTVWETLAEDEESPPVFESVEEDADFSETEIFVSHEKVEPKEVERPAKKRVQDRRTIRETCIKEPLGPLQGKYCFKSNPLQNAVVWSEILSKPVALRGK